VVEGAEGVGGGGALNAAEGVEVRGGAGGVEGGVDGVGGLVQAGGLGLAGAAAQQGAAVGELAEHPLAGDAEADGAVGGAVLGAAQEDVAGLGALDPGEEASAVAHPGDGDALGGGGVHPGGGEADVAEADDAAEEVAWDGGGWGFVRAQLHGLAAQAELVAGVGDVQHAVDGHHGRSWLGAAVGRVGRQCPRSEQPA
jgi:hypothetical protein